MLRKLETSQKNILEYEVTGKITKAENHRLLREIKTLIDNYGTIKILFRVLSIPTADISAVSDRLSFAKDYLNEIEKYALVTDSKVLTSIEKIIDSATKMEFKVFPPDKEKEARVWLR